MVENTFLDCARTELQKGVNLVEASAGTGKTYAIAMLVLRFVTELGLPVDSILVVTFTKAATEELRSRIRGRLAEARDLLEGQLTEPDDTMLAWLETVSDHEQVKKRLQLALFDIDRAGIFTIHSFCQRMLTEQALESGQLFDVELLADISHVNSEAVEDYWRRKIYTLPVTACAVLTGEFQTPGELYASVSRVGRNIISVQPKGLSIDDTIVEFEKSYNSLVEWWKHSSEDLYTCFINAYEAGQFKKPLIDVFPDWWRTVSLFFTQEGAPLPADLHYLTQAGVQQTLNARKVPKAKQQAFLADWPFPEELIAAFLLAVDSLILAFRYDLILQLRHDVDARLHDQGHMSFDDLIVRLDEALSHEGDDLRNILSKRFNVALIDEFQDTDAAQWRIFSTLFASDTHYLYLIGDPKQAIYRFRGADIYSYFTAKNRAEYHLTLKHNYRSHPDLVYEVNRIFSSRPDSFSFDEKLMPFQAVEPAKTDDNGSLYRGNEKLAVMNYCQLSTYSEDKTGRWTSGKAATRFLEYIVAEICNLLDSDNPVTIRKVVDGRVVETDLVARDIAILVRSNDHADRYLKGLADAGVPAILSSKKGVFQTAECSELYTLLQALAAPGDSYSLKSAMTISWFNLSGNDLQHIWQSETAFDGWFNRFLNYYQLWQGDGFLTMMNSLLESENVYTTLANSPLAERRIANIHHLLELVQEVETAEKYGPDQTLIWLRSMIAGKPGVEDRELRLESDEQAVRIVTMHSAKGLQYPVVFCPYLWYRSSRLKTEKHLISCHDEQNNLIVDIGSENFETHRDLAIAEELAEDLRLLYVALTRAEFRCYTMWVDTNPHMRVAQAFDSALGYLLFPDSKPSFAEQSEMFADLSMLEGVEHTVIDTEPEDLILYNPKRPYQGLLASLTPTSRSLYSEYQMSSYSAMAALSEHEDHGSDVLAEEAEDAEERGDNILHLGLPAGANFGNLVHDSLEIIPFESLARQDDNRLELTRLCKRYGVAMEPEDVQDFLATIVTTSLVEEQGDCLPFALADLNQQRCLKEMPFYFHMDHMETEALNVILQDEPTVVPLSHRTMRGYLTGFVDLFFEHDGRYYILDYKTNYLGDKCTDYSEDKLVQAMASHNYGLQYWIYTLVLHKHLQNMTADYDYETHFGGVMYLFVRGMVPEIPGSGVYFTRPSLELLLDLEDAVGGVK